MAVLIMEVLTEAEAAVVAAQPQEVRAAEQIHNLKENSIYISTSYSWCFPFNF
jgi:hypothetical protein